MYDDVTPRTRADNIERTGSERIFPLPEFSQHSVTSSYTVSHHHTQCHIIIFPLPEFSLELRCLRRPTEYFFSVSCVKVSIRNPDRLDLIASHLHCHSILACPDQANLSLAFSSVLLLTQHGQRTLVRQVSSQPFLPGICVHPEGSGRLLLSYRDKFRVIAHVKVLSSRAWAEVRHSVTSSYIVSHHHTYTRMSKYSLLEPGSRSATSMSRVRKET